MIDGFYNNKTPNIESIKELDDWIENIFGDSVRNYSGNYTNVDMLKRVALEYGNFIEDQVDIYREGSASFLKENLELGNPIIVAVYTNMLLKGERKDRLHFMVLTGMDDEYVYVNDPGKTLGKNNQYTIEQFKLAWSKNNYASIIFKVNNQERDEPLVEEIKGVDTNTNTSIFHNITTFFKNLFHNDDTGVSQSQAQESATVESILVEEQPEQPKVEDPVYDAVFLPAVIPVDVSLQDDVVTAPVVVKNTGNTTWKQNEISLNVVGGIEKNSAWYTDTWKTSLRPAVINKSVEPGDTVTVNVLVSRPTDFSSVFKLQLVRQQGTRFLQLGSGFATVSFTSTEEEKEIVEDVREEQAIEEGPTIIEKIKDVSKVLGDKIIDTTKKVIDTVVPFFYSGGGSSSNNSVEESSSPESSVDNEETLLPEITLDESFGQTFSIATTTVTLFGIKNNVTTDVFSSVTSTTFSFTTTTWEAFVSLVEGENDITLTPVDASGVEGDPITLSILRDTLAPTISSFSVLQDSTTSTIIHVEWAVEEVSSTIHYALQVHEDDSGWIDLVTTTEETVYTFFGEQPHVYTFRVRASDVLGNTSEWIESGESISLDWPKTVVINEIAWGGTSSAPTQTRDCPKQEWMELKNTTDSVIDLSGWHLAFTSPSGVTSSLALSGTIDAGEYYLLARRENGQDALVGLSIDMVYEHIDLDNEGMNLVLSDAEGNTIDEISYIDVWPAGGPGRSMERIGSGNQWKTTEHMTARGQANGCTNVLYGSPLQPN
ncbi:MAG: hypothetical protein COY70_02230, partial [Candidatus Magasanikbacteria bacterium CG_4_10_14_0_8_um_filter_42_12]